MIGNRNGAGEPPKTFGTYPAGPKVGVPTAAAAGSIKVGKVAHRASGLAPSHETLDYMHKLTSTTVLLIALAAFLILGPRTIKGKLRAIAKRHVGGN